MTLEEQYRQALAAEAEQQSQDGILHSAIIENDLSAAFGVEDEVGVELGVEDEEGVALGAPPPRFTSIRQAKKAFKAKTKKPHTLAKRDGKLQIVKTGGKPGQPGSKVKGPMPYRMGGKKSPHMY